MAKCPKCENNTFTMENVKSPTKMVWIKCSECNSVISTLEDINLEAWRESMLKNHGYFEQEFNKVKNELGYLKEELDKKNMLIIELLETINRKLK